MFKKIKNRKGFTLIELIVVIAILAVLAAIIIPTVANNIARANDARDLANTRSALAAYTVALLVLDENAAALPTAPTPPGATAACTTNASLATRTLTTFSCNFGTGRTFSLQPNGEVTASCSLIFILIYPMPNRIGFLLLKFRQFPT
jgi:prepilin-type N-terminal cleavage/methylation domain-containing protein